MATQYVGGVPVQAPAKQLISKLDTSNNTIPVVRPAPPVYRPNGAASRGELEMAALEDSNNVGNQVRASMDATTAQPSTTADLISQLLGMSSAASGGGSSGGRKSGGSAPAGVSPGVHDAMISYLEYLKKKDVGAPFNGQEGRINAAADQGRADIGTATASLQDHVTAAQAASQQQQAIRNAALAQLEGQYGASSGNALQQALTSLRSQGVGTGTLEAQGLANQQDHALFSQAQGGSTASSDAALSQFLTAQGATAQAAAAGGTQGLDNTRLALLAQVAQQRQAAESAQQDAIQQFMLQMATAGVTA